MPAQPQRTPRYYRPKCDQCEILVINGVICHETGCPDAWKGKTATCKLCDEDFKLQHSRQIYCRSCVKSIH